MHSSLYGTAVAVAAAKDAALYFDHVVPLGLAPLGRVESVTGRRVCSSVSFDDVPRDPILRELLPPEITTRDNNMCSLLHGIEIYVRASQDRHDAGWLEALVSPDIANKVAKLARENSRDPITPQLMQESVEWVSHLQTQDRAGKLSFFAGVPLRGSTASTASVALTLKQLNLVDTKNVSWEQIHEFRKDLDNVKRLRNLRLDLARNYEGKDPEFVRDDLERRLEEYREAAKLWGFSTRERAMSIVLSDKSTAAVTVATIAGLVLGDGPTATAAGAYRSNRDTRPGRLGSQEAAPPPRR